MRQYDTINILDMIGAIGETKLRQRLSDFSCPKNPEILKFYQDEENGFMPFDERYSVSDSTKYIQLFNFF